MDIFYNLILNDFGSENFSKTWKLNKISKENSDLYIKQ